MRKPTGDELTAMASAMQAFVPHVERTDPAYFLALALLAYNALADHRRQWLRETIAEHMHPWLDRDYGVPPRHKVLEAADVIIDGVQKAGILFELVSGRNEAVAQIDNIIDQLDPRHRSGINRSSAPYWETGASEKTA